MKKLIILLLAAFVLPVVASAQQSSKIQQAFTQEEIEAIVTQDPNEMAFLEYMADRAANVRTMNGDISAMPEISELNALKKNASIPDVNADNFNVETFNPLAYNLDIENTVYQFRLGNTNQVVQILSENRTRHLFDSGQ